MCKSWVAASEIAAVLSITKRAVNKRATQEGWAKRVFATNGGHQYRYRLSDLPEDVQIAIAKSLQISLNELRSDIEEHKERTKKAVIPRYSGYKKKKQKSVIPFEQLPEERREIARLRERVIFTWSDSGLALDEFVRHYADGLVARELKENLGPHGDIKSWQSFYRWLAAYETYGIAGLAPLYPVRKGGNGASLDQRVKELVWFYYLNKNKWSIAKVLRTLEQKEGVSVSKYIVYRYIKTEIPESVKAYFRKGKKYFHDKFESYIEIDYNRYYSMQLVVYDHKTFDFASRVLRSDGWHRVRLFLTCIIDKRSRKILGWWIDEVPSTLTAIRATRMMVERYGCPAEAQFDNGRDFTSYWFTGSSWEEQHLKIGKKEIETISSVTDDLGMAVHFSTPYRGQSKHIERLFGFISAEFDKTFESYLGSNTAERPDEAKLYYGSFEGSAKRPVEELPTLEETRELFGRWVDWYNSSHKHSGEGMDGRTPNEVFEANLRSRRDIPEEYQKFIWTRRELRVVQRNGVKSDDQWYWNPRLQMLVGEKVELRVSIDDIGQAYIFSLEGEYLFDATSEFKDSGIAEENNRKLARQRKAAKKHLEKYKQAINEIKKDKKTRLEELRKEKESEVVLQVVHGEPITVKGAAPALTLVPSKSKRKIKGLFDD